jgi:two-component system secretion response regulator SsrB
MKQIITPTSTKPIRILLIDDDLIYCKSIQKYFSHHPIIEIVQYFHQSDNLTKTQLLNIDYTHIILDLYMPNKTGIEMLESLNTWEIQAPVIVSTSYLDSHYFKELQAFGVQHCIKKSAPELFANYIISLIENGNHLDSSTSHVKLNDREINLLKLIAQGKKQHEIADVMNLSKDSIKKIKANLAKKLSIQNTSLDFFQKVKENMFLI